MDFTNREASQQLYPDFTFHDLDESHGLFVGRIPGESKFSESDVERLWNLHPEEFHEIMMHGRLVKTPRWQQAYGKDYHYTGNVNRALALPQQLKPLLGWCVKSFDERLNGILLNWYDGSLGHYIGAHRDSTTRMHVGAPIVTVSLGEQRVFRMRPFKGKGLRDFDVENGTVLVLPYATNMAWKHEIPKAKRYQGRRISITLRAFE